MERSYLSNYKSVIFVLVVLATSFSAVQADQIFAPQILWDRGIAQKSDPVLIADTHLGIPYRDDGALDHQGYFTTFAHPETYFDTPGLNCSGLVLSVSRFLLNKNRTLVDVTRDRLNNSGPNSPMGKDWDFGWDLVLNISEGQDRQIIMPDGTHPDIQKVDGASFRGFDMLDSSAWSRILPQLKPGHIYIGDISKTGSRGYKVLHYHVVMIIPDGSGGAWLYHATKRSQVHKMNLAGRQGLERFFGQFRNSKPDDKKMLLLEVSLQDARPPQQPLTAQAEPEKPVGPNPVTVSDTGQAPPPQEPPVAPVVNQTGPEIVLNHLSGKVYKPIPELVTHIPRLVPGDEPKVKFSFTNRGQTTKNLQILLECPGAKAQFSGKLDPETKHLSVTYPDDFEPKPTSPIKMGEYLADLRIDGATWCANLFEVSLQKEAEPKITQVRVPSETQVGRPFTVRVEAENRGVESDYGGITVSCPDPSALRIVSAKPGKVFPSGSTVLAVTSDRIRTKFPMAERWIEVWGEKKMYELTVQVQAAKSGRFPIFVRCALRGVNVKSSVIQMDPKSSDTVDQQGFPVKVYWVSVK